jgi:hypothetical protein
MSETVFPVYRQYRGGASLFRIESPDRFVELKEMGNAWLKFEIFAQTYPEKLFILDLINFGGPQIMDLNKEDFEKAEMLSKRV